MALRLRAHGLGLALPLGLVVLLGAIGWLQYRWTGELSRAEAVRLKSSLEDALARFSEDLDDEGIARVFRSFAVRSHEEQLPDALADWREHAPYPDLVADVYTLHFADSGEIVLRRLALEGAFEPAAWPDGLAGFRNQLARFRHPRPERGERPPPLPVLSHDPFALFVPAFRERRREGTGALGTLVTLRSSVLDERILPDLASRHFGASEEAPYDVVVLDEKGEVAFASRKEGAASVVDAPDASAQALFFRRGFRSPRSPVPEAHYEVFVRHRAGSLDAAVGSARRRNLAVGLSILALLGGSVVLVATSARRAVELGERKMEFVAGVSHELRTPLAVIRSAAQNLTDGSVSSADQIRKYGALVDAESRRLQDLVEQVLELAGIQSQRRVYRRDPVSTLDLVREAVADSRSAASERGARVETTLPEGDLYVLGEHDALRRALSNLVANAIKHGGPEGPEGKDNVVSIDVSSRDGLVSLAVTDSGPGIPESDLPHLFEPFYRGSRSRERQTRGSGLGLTLVDHIAKEHGGRVYVSTSRSGSRFALVLPEARTAP
jgi:signal transduction histidine kinase